MHERTERALCRLAFLLLCALPTLSVMSLTVLTWTPWYHNRQVQSLEDALSQRLGVNVSISDMHRPTPSSWQLDGVEFTDPETGNLVSKVRSVSYAEKNGMVLISLAQPELQAAQLSLIWRIVHDRFLCQPELLGQAVTLTAQDLSIHSRLRGITFSPVRVRIDSKAEATRAWVQFLLADWSPEDMPATVSVTRTRSGDAPKTHWELQTGSRPLPCSVLADYLPVMRMLGLDAEFSGLLSWHMERDDYFVRLQEAYFTNVNMLELFEPLDYHVSGMGTIHLTSLTRHSGMPISEAVGKISIQGGRIEVGLLRRLAGLFQANLNLPTEIADRERLECQLVASEFQLYGNDIQVRGICSQQRNFESSITGTAVVAHDRPVLMFDPSQRVASRQLTSTIDPHGRAGIQVSGNKDWARQLLPQLDRRRSEADQTGPPSVGRLRLQR